MNKTVKQALGPLEARAQSEFGTADRISLRDFIIAVEIGAFQVERDVVQRLKFNIVVDVPPYDPALDDDVDKILSYDSLTEAIEIELAYERLNLLETLAERIAARILHHDQAHRVFLRVEKLDRGAGDLGVEIWRETGQMARVADVKQHPDIVFLTKDAIASPFIGGWMRAITKRQNAVVICVDDDKTAKGRGKAQAHIDVLALDQMAWRVGALEDQCLVVGSRTELNWAIAQGKKCVWAPYKMVFDAVTPPTRLEPAELAFWLCAELGGGSLSCVGPTDDPDRYLTVYPVEKVQDYQ